MVRIKEVDLPGVGRKYSLNLADGKLLTLIIHHSGRREIYLMEDPEDDEPDTIISLKDDEARKIGAIIAGSDYQPVTDEKMELLLGDLFIEWVRVGEKSPLAGMSLQDSSLKNTFGVTVIGIQRGEEIIGSPGADTVVRPLDVLMVVGRRDQIKSLEDLCSQEKMCRVPGGWKT